MASGSNPIQTGTPRFSTVHTSSNTETIPDDLVITDSDDEDSRRNKLSERAKTADMNIISPLRDDKKLLVLDIDHTILDPGPLLRHELNIEECTRPYVHDFLEAVYPYYDICIWSRTNRKRVEKKIRELGMFGERQNYKISFILDKSSMLTYSHSHSNGRKTTYPVKPLQVIWNRLHQFNEANTVHVDNRRNNFKLNRPQGIKVSAYEKPVSAMHRRLAANHTPKLSLSQCIELLPANVLEENDDWGDWSNHSEESDEAHVETAKESRTFDLVDRDVELKTLAQYLISIAESGKDFTELDHKYWRKSITSGG